jgi:hypothetical protein
MDNNLEYHLNTIHAGMREMLVQKRPAELDQVVWIIFPGSIWFLA